MSDLKKAGKAVVAEEGGLESIKDLAAMMPARSLSRELLQKLGDDPTTYQVGRLVATLHSDMQANVESYHVLTDTASGTVPSRAAYATPQTEQTVQTVAPGETTPAAPSTATPQGKTGDIDPQRIRDAIAGRTRGVVDVRGLDTPMRSVSVDELIAASRAGMRRERYVPAQMMDTESAANSEARSMSPDEAAETTRDADVERLRLDTAVGERYNQNADVIAEKIGAVEREVEQQQQNVNAVASPTRIKCINEHLKGTRHRKTNVAFVERIVAIDGQQCIVVAPEFDSVFDTWLPESMRYKSDDIQFRECNRRLYEQIVSNPGLRALFSRKDLVRLSRGHTPENYTWHHDVEVGKMQLVLTEIHKKTGHKGGRSLWGGGKEYR